MTVMSMGVVCVCSRETRGKTERDGDWQSEVEKKGKKERGQREIAEIRCLGC